MLALGRATTVLIVVSVLLYSLLTWFDDFPMSSDGSPMSFQGLVFFRKVLSPTGVLYSHALT